jgi:hypothetical protein
VRVDLEIAATFVSLARFDLKKGETDHAARLLVLAHRAAEVISGMLQNVATADATPLRARLRLLEDSIREAHAQPKAPAA